MVKTPAQTPDNLGLVPEQAVGGARVHCGCMLARAFGYTCVYFFYTLNPPQTGHAPLSSPPPVKAVAEAGAVGFSLPVMRS